MRVDEVAYREYGRKSRNHRRRRLHAAGVHHALAFGSLHCDVAEFSAATHGSSEGFQWMVAYVRLIPEKLAAERVRKAIVEDQPRDDALANALIMDVL
ncbi:MAG: hypothetical protein GF418_05725 [Chitinivibrionales bacterium]|nr:hypothetical protein [Chitinivibrionales bacterium]MBD3395109.1 hypothetical protein [Chitinivibrionales bacterium]